jgi:hypothetical protein
MATPRTWIALALGTMLSSSLVACVRAGGSSPATTADATGEDRCKEWTPTGSHIARLRCDPPETTRARREHDREALRKTQIRSQTKKTAE